MNTGGYVDEIYTAEQYRSEHQSICLGTAGFGDKIRPGKSFEILNAFVRAGGNFIDTAKCLLQMAKRTWKLQ